MGEQVLGFTVPSSRLRAGRPESGEKPRGLVEDILGSSCNSHSKCGMRTSSLKTQSNSAKVVIIAIFEVWV